MWSIIDYGLRDFLRNKWGIPYTFVTREEAEEWLLKEEESLEAGWTNEGTKYLNWNETE